MKVSFIPLSLMVSAMTVLVVQVFLGSILDFIVGLIPVGLILFAFVLGRRIGRN